MFEWHWSQVSFKAAIELEVFIYQKPNNKTNNQSLWQQSSDLKSFPKEVKLRKSLIMRMFIRMNSFDLFQLFFCSK